MEKAKRRFRITIQLKITAIITVFALLLGSIAMIFFNYALNKNNEQHSKDTATNLSATVAETVDVYAYVIVKDKIQSVLDTIEQPVFSDQWGTPEWDAYIAKFEPAIEECAAYYNNLLASLNNIATKNGSEVDCVYLVFCDARTNGFVYVVDSVGEDGCPPGCIDPIYDFNEEILTNPARGFPAYITNTDEYGWLCTAGTPIYQGASVVGYVMVDVSMGAIKAAQSQAVLRLGLYILLAIAVMWISGFIIIHFLMIKPLRKLNNAAKNYVATEDNKDSEVFANLNIKTRDEIEDLANSMSEMEKDINRKINEIANKDVQLIETKQEAIYMTELANKDALTGVRNKTSYDYHVGKIDNQIYEGRKPEFGIVMIDLNDLKVTNDVYGHNAGDIALMKLASLVCGIFARSPVFRVGGDEFVIIIQNTDYQQITKLEKEFNSKIASIQNDQYLRDFEKISAAIGYAKYDSNIDKSVKDVFNRADEAMYVRKREMKSKQ